MGKILTFSTGEYLCSQKGADIVEQSIRLTKEAIKNYSTGTVKSKEYDELNKVVKDAMVTYATERTPYIDPSYIDTKTVEGFAQAFQQFSSFREMFFSVIQETLKKVNSKVEMQQMLTFAEIKSGAEGDSENFLIQSNGLVEFEGVGYSNNSTRHNFFLNDNATVLPERKEASVGLDLYQFNAGFFDYGEMLATLAVSMRRSLHKEVVTKMFDTTDLTGSPFLLSTFAKETWMTANEKLSAINGAKTVAYGTVTAFGRITDSLDAKYFYGGLGDKVVQSGYIPNVYGTTGIVLDQAVNINDANYAFDLPSNKILLASGADKPLKVFMEGSVYIQEDDGRNNAVMQKSYKVMTAWGSKKATNYVTGMQIIGA